LAAAVLGSRRVSAAPTGKVGGEIFSEVEFPPPEPEYDPDRIVRLAKVAERAARIKGLRDFIIAASWTESKWKPTAFGARDSAAAIRGWERNRGTRYIDNPWISQKSRWSYSGGALGEIPSSALATSDKLARNMDPARVFDLPYALAFAADMVVRLRNHWGATNWDRVRAGFASPDWADEHISHAGRQRVHRHFREALKEAQVYGVDLYLDDRGVNVRSYPGFEAVLSALLAAEGRTS
jgi:hypothetical protein